MPSIEQMRGEISLVYPGAAWAAKVNRMSENQVCAVYHRMSTTGKLEEAAKERQRDRRVKQLSFFDKGYGL